MPLLAPFALVEAFCTENPGSGNPAGVVLLDNFPSDEMMQQIAATVNQAETAFVTPDGDGFRIRWFTPGVEVRLCGHATLASAAFLSLLNPELEKFVFQSLSGELAVAQEGRNFVLDFPAYPPVQADVAEVKHAFPHAVELWKNRDDWMVVLSDAGAVENYQPDFDTLRTMGQRGLAITSEGVETDFVCRFFAPQSGVDEDHATGSAQTYLVPFWANTLGKNKLSSIQLSIRNGLFESELAGDRVKIGGIGRMLVTGKIQI